MSEKNQITPIGPDDSQSESLLEKLSADRRQFVSGIAAALGAGVLLNATASAASAQTTGTAPRQIISFKLSKDDLTSIGQVVSRLDVTATGVDPSQPGAFTIRNHSFNPDVPGAFTIRNHNFNASSPGAYTIRNYQFSAG